MKDESIKKEIMHKNDPVALVNIDKRGFISKIEDIYYKELLPCVYSEEEADLKIGLQRWMLGRQLGRTRNDIAPIKSFYGQEIFQSKNMVSLQDSYWIRESDEDTWDMVNPYDEKNWDYEEDCYFELLHDPENTFEVDNMSPNLTIPGNEARFWYKKDGNIGLITESSQKDMKVYKKAKELGIDKFVAPRVYMIIHGIIYSYHPTGTDANTERIPFDLLYDSVADPALKKIDNLRNCCDKFGITGWKDFMSSIMKLDTELGNKGRSLYEIGVLRDVETLKIKGFEQI